MLHIERDLLLLPGGLILQAPGIDAPAHTQAQKPRMCLITKTDTNPFSVKMRKSAQAKADELGTTLTAFADREEDDNEGQVSAMESCMANQVDGMLIVPTDSAGDTRTCCLRVLLGFLLLLGPLQSVAQPCTAGQYTVCLNGNCLCIPALSGDLEAMAAQAIRTFDQMRAPVLEAWLMASRNAVFLDAEPVPLAVRTALAGTVPQDVLDRARYKVGYSDSLNLGHVAMNYGDLLHGKTVQAMTLIDVILFRADVSDPASLPLWIHELTHVQQFMDWGVREFAQRYIDDPSSVEAPAYAAEMQGP